MSLFITLLYILFVLAAIVLATVILLQEGKGGGFSDALGTAGQQTFGVKAQGIHKFTGVVAAIFLVSALLITYLNGKMAGSTILGNDGGSVFDALPDAGTPPATPPAGGGGSGGETGENK